MKFFTKTVLIATVTVALALMGGCGPKPIQKQSILDTPDNHYKQGLRELEKENIAGAMEEFERAKGINKDYGLAYAGIGLVWAAKGDFKQALDNANKAVSLDGKNPEVYVMKGRIITQQRKEKKWLEDAVKQYDKAHKLNADFSMAHFYKGVTFKMAYKFSDASAAFRKVIDLKGAYAKEANAEWEIVQKIERAVPGTAVGSKIALMDKIDRADLAVLLIEELKISKVLEQRRKKTYDTSFKGPEDTREFEHPEAKEAAAATDIQNHWAKNWILNIITLEVGGLKPFPDHTFRPDEKITRGNYAQVMQDMLILISNDEALATKFFGEASHFPDVRSDHYAYNAIALCASRGIMKAKLDGSFGLADTVSGADALLTIRQLQNVLQLKF